MKIGLLGFPLGKSLSKYLYQTLHKTTGFRVDLFEFETQHPFEAIEKMRDNGFDGFFVTIPYKRALLDMTLGDELVRRSGNLNCVCIKNGILFATNTDYSALGMLLDSKGIDVSKKRATIIGRGSASLTSVGVLIERGVKEISMLVRDMDEGRIKIFRDLYGDLFSFSLLSQVDLIESDILVNATPLGMYYDFLDLRIDASVIIDFAYLKNGTHLGEIAKRIHASFIDGREILVMQGLFGLKHIFGVDVLDRYDEIYANFLDLIKEV